MVYIQETQLTQKEFHRLKIKGCKMTVYKKYRLFFQSGLQIRTDQKRQRGSLYNG